MYQKRLHITFGYTDFFAAVFSGKNIFVSFIPTAKNNSFNIFLTFNF